MHDQAEFGIAAPWLRYRGFNFMTSYGTILAFFADGSAAQDAFDQLQSAGFRQTALLHLPAQSDEVGSARIHVQRTRGAATKIGTAGALAGACVGRALAPTGREVPLFSATGAFAGGALGWCGAQIVEESLPEKLISRFESQVTSGESLVIVRAPSKFLTQARTLVVGEGATAPAVFLERAAIAVEDVLKAPLRREVLPLESLRELAVSLGKAHANAHKRDRGGAFLLRRLDQNSRIISRVVRGLGQAARLQQSVSLSAEWLLDNNYIIQGQIKDVQRNLTPKFLRELLCPAGGKYAHVPRIYLLASELISVTDSRLDKEYLLDFIHHYQLEAPLSTGELWALPLTIRLAIIENLRRLTAQADQRQRDRERADYWANRLLAAAFREPDKILPLLAELSGEQKKIAPHFADRLVSHLFDEEAALGPVRAWLERKLDAPLAEITAREQRRQAADSVSVGNCITTLRFLSGLDWRECFEQLSLVDAILAQDPAGVYRSMDFSTRDHYRKEIEKLARGAKISELEVAQLAVKSAAEATRARVQRAAPAHGDREHQELIYQPAGHIGFYLVDQGQTELEKIVGYRRSQWSRFRRWVRDNPDKWYFGLIGIATVASLATLARFGRAVGGALPLPLQILAILPSSEVAVQVVNYAVTRLIPPRPLAKLEFKEGVPVRWKTAVVIPMLLSSDEDGPQSAHALELHYLANPDPHLNFALLADFVDAPVKHADQDNGRLEKTRAAIAALNQRHGARFSLFIRERRWSETEDRWMGWERKRGKIEEFNTFLRGRKYNSPDQMHPVEGDLDWGDTRFVITLDADTQLPYGAAIRLIETLAHPLNRPVIDATTTLVKRGYALIQPRVDTMLPSATATRFSRLFADASGLDPYTSVVSDVYQDAFGEGSYHGKGIYDLEVFDRVLGERFPDATLLSHDLIEGAHVRVGVASDIILLDKFPPNYLAASKRDHRWIRGDWQIAQWLLPIVTGKNGREKNPLSTLNKWKIKDNLRRSLLAPSCVVMLLGGWMLGGSSAVAASVGVAGLMLWPTAINIFTRLTTAPDTLLRGRHEIGRGLLRGFIETALLLHRAGLCLDAISRVLYRKNFSHKLLLEWQTAASTFGDAPAQSRAFLLRLAAGSALAGVAAVATLHFGGALALGMASPFLLSWASAPFVVWWLWRENEKVEDRALGADDTKYLREIARQTWRYFDDFVGPQTNWLPPDNYQESLNVEIAQRTSPTNMGLWLLACVAAHDFGWLTLDEVASRCLSSLETFEEMEKHEGHLLNWYSSLNMEPLRPRYISTVDSGNLLGSLWTLARSMKEIYRAPLFDAKPLQGLRDTVGILESVLGSDTTAFATELGEIYRLLDSPHGSALDILATLRRLERPISSLSRALSMRPLPKRASQRAKSNLESAATDPRFTISAPSYWAAQLETQLDLWIQSIARYGLWLETLGAPSDEFLMVLGADAPALRARAMADVPSLALLARGENPLLSELLGRTKEVEVPAEVRAWGQKVREEYERSRWLAGEMLAGCEGVVDRARGLADGMNMAFLFDPSRKLFSIGFNVDERRLDSNYYDLLASECRLASFCSVARGDVPASHWLALGRRFGETPAGTALMSWSGTMFEYLMPLLFQRAFRNSLLERAVQVAVGAQIAYGQRRNVPWGISEAAFSALDASRTYQYKAFGTPGLGLKRGLEDDLVVAPYATLMALMVDKTAALENLRRLEKIGLRGDYGFYESIDFTRERLDEDSIVEAGEGETERKGGRDASAGQSGAIVRCFMVHHQGMALLAMQNVLLDWPVQRRFHSDVFVQAAEPLLFEKVPEAPPVLEDTALENVRPTRVDLGGSSSERSVSTDTPAPRAHLLGSEDYSVVVTAVGSGYSSWRGTEITRWRADTTRDNWGQFLYLRDLESGLSWSATHQPLKRAARRMGVSFKSEKIEFDRRDAEIEARLEICVSPEDSCEVRRLTLVNHSSRQRKIEATSYAELSLAPHNADRAHQAFNKLFIQTGIIPEYDAILAWRRLRSSKEKPIFAAHLLASGSPADEIQFETDRSKFLGRTRSAENPVALEGDLSATVGAVLDPCFSLRRRVTLRPGERVQIAWVTAVAESEGEINRLIQKYNEFGACERAFDLAWTHSQLELHHLQIPSDEAQTFQNLAGYLLYPHAALRAPVRRIRDNAKGQSGLWAYGISGDLPILLVAIDNARDLPVVKQAIRAQTFWRVRGFQTDLVIINEQAGGYAQDLTDTLRKTIESSTPYTGVEKSGGVFLRSSDTIPPEDMTLLLTVARVVIVAARGTLGQQIGALSDEIELAPRFLATQKEVHDAIIPLPFLELPYFNGLGGFTAGGREYAIYLGPGDRTPAPWINVFAHEHFGALTSESGNGFAWFGNSQSNRILPWNNDPVSDTASEAIYIRDEEIGSYWTPTPLPIREADAYRARHGQGYSVFEHNSHGIEQELTVFVPLDGRNRPVRIQNLRLKNLSSRKRRLQVTYYGELLLGTTKEEHQMHVVTSWDDETATLLARNAFHPDFAGRVVFASATPSPTAHSGSREAFLGRNGSPSHPVAMRRKTTLEQTGAGLDPAAILQVPVELAPGEEIVVAFLLGQAASADEAKNLVSGLRSPSAIERALTQTKEFWDQMLATLQVNVPDQAVNFLINRWLPYQTLSCRIWARSAFYQSGGAWGFRDQLQDSLALTTLYPQAARDQILRSARQQFEEGDVQHWWHPPGNAGVRTLITDDLLFLPYAVCQYVKVTGDASILEETVPFLHAPVLKDGEHEKYFQPQISGESATIYEHCRRAIEKGCTFGPNGIPLIGGGDWNDGLNRVGIEGRGESVWLAWFVIDVLRNFADLALSRGDDAMAQNYRKRAEQYARNIDLNCWDGEYYKRGFFDDGTPLGSARNKEAKIDSLPQSWASITGAGDPARREKAMQSLEKHLVLEDEKMVLLFTPAFDTTEKDPGYIKGYLPGVRENGGQYTHAACWVAYAYARAGQGTKAVHTLRLLNPVEHARTPQDVATYKVEPYVVCADVYNLPGQVGRGGWTWYTGSCGWMYRAWVEGVLGFDKRGHILKINPAIPAEWKEFSMKYRHGQTLYSIRVENPHGVENGVLSVSMNGVILGSSEIPLLDDGIAREVVVTMGQKTLSEAAAEETTTSE